MPVGGGRRGGPWDYLILDEVRGGFPVHLGGNWGTSFLLSSTLSLTLLSSPFWGLEDFKASLLFQPH